MGSFVEGAAVCVNPYGSILDGVGHAAGLLCVYVCTAGADVPGR